MNTEYVRDDLHAHAGIVRAPHGLYATVVHLLLRHT
jgi:hypothetical protein